MGIQRDSEECCGLTRGGDISWRLHSWLVSVLKESGFFFFRRKCASHFDIEMWPLWANWQIFSLLLLFFSLSPVADKTQLFHFHNVKSLEMLERGGWGQEAIREEETVQLTFFSPPPPFHLIKIKSITMYQLNSNAIERDDKGLSIHS